MEHTGHNLVEAGVSARVQALTARNLNLLRDIENTLSALETDTRLVDTIADAFKEILDRLQADVPSAAIDPGEEIGHALTRAGESVNRMHASAIGRHQSARDDPRLGREDGVADAYTGLIAALERTFNTIGTLQDWIETHDAILEPSTGVVYDNVDDLIAALNQ